MLAAIAGKLPIPTPRVEAIGEHTGWSYILMNRLGGEGLATAWPRIGEHDRERLLAELGEALAALHSIRDPVLATLAPPVWAAFVAAQRASAVERQRLKGLDAAWLEQLPAFLDAVPLEVPAERVRMDFARAHPAAALAVLRRHAATKDKRAQAMLEVLDPGSAKRAKPVARDAAILAVLDEAAGGFDWPLFATGIEDDPDAMEYFELRLIAVASKTSDAWGSTVARAHGAWSRASPRRTARSRRRSSPATPPRSCPARATSTSACTRPTRCNSGDARQMPISPSAVSSSCSPM